MMAVIVVVADGSGPTITVVVQFGHREPVRRSGVRADGRLSLHSLRHGYASLRIAEGLDVVFVSRQLGHADPGVTLSVYAHLFARAKHALAARSALEAGYATMALSRL